MGKSNETYASISAEITVDLKRVGKYDDWVKKFRKDNIWITLVSLIFIVISASLFYFQHFIVGGILGVLALVILNFRIRRRKFFTDDKIADIYTNGLLIPAVVCQTDPLTILALADVGTGNEAPQRYGCIEAKISSLPGHLLIPGERIPCAAMFALADNPDYWLYYLFHPLCWATEDWDAIQRNTNRLKDEKEWKALERLAQTLPHDDLDLIHILDEDYNLISSRRYYEEYEENGE